MLQRGRLLSASDIILLQGFVSRPGFDTFVLLLHFAMLPFLFIIYP